MAYITGTGTAPQTQELKGLKQGLINAFNYSHNINRQMDEMTDAQIVSQYGIPLATVTVVRANIDAIIVALDADAIQAMMAQLGFDV